MSAYIHNLGQAFAATAVKHADRPALIMADHTMPFAELDSRSNRIARFLLSRGVRRNDVVAIFNEKLDVCYALMLACLKLGAIYTNVDTTSPEQRQRRILETCAPALCLAGVQTAERAWSISAELNVEMVSYADISFAEAVAAMDDARLPEIYLVTGEDPAYLMFTSGSTGFPKGVVISHASLLNFIAWGRTTFDVSASDVFTNVNPMHFDNSVFDFYVSLFNGAALVPVDQALASNPRHMVRYVSEKGCTIWFSVPSMLVFCLRMRAIESKDLPDMRHIVFGGEGFPKSQLRELHGLVGDRISLVNVYGPTECTCICSAYPVGVEDLESPGLLPLGELAPNFGYRIIDRDGNHVPEGESGELQLKGPNVGKGYYRDPERTAQAFVQDPMCPYAERAYNTGDIVRLDVKTGSLHFLGRKDNQIKRMGYRIELEEIEHGLGSLPFVAENGCVFIPSENGETGCIVAFVNSGITDENEVLSQLLKVVPAYMKPDRIVFMDELPKNANGKIDRTVLPNLLEL